MSKKPSEKTTGKRPASGKNKNSVGQNNVTAVVVKKVFSYILNSILTLMLVGLLTGAIVGVVFAVYVKNNIDSDMTEFMYQTTQQDMTTHIYYMEYENNDRTNRAGGTPVEIENQKLFSNENRTWTSYNDFPTYLAEAFVSIEDERFWEHHGVDWKRTLSATFYYFTGSKHYGGSTITQQLIKNITEDDDVTIQRKIQEIMRAQELEKQMTKEEILEMYLNTIYLSQHCYGISSAAEAYFGKEVKDLTLVECAAMAAIPKYPTEYDPFQNPDNNKERRNIVLYKMYELGKITEEEYNEAIKTELVLNENITSVALSATTSWYTDAVIDESIDLLMDSMNLTSENIASKMVYTGGLQIYTVMDPRIQEIMENYFENPDNFSRINDGVQPESSMVVMDPATGDILGIVGGRGEKSESRVLNYATQTTRSPGSSIKPVAVYGPSLEYGLINYSTVVDDNPIRVINGSNWPVNYPAGYRGPTTIHDAICRSVNTVAVRVLEYYLGFESSYDFIHNKLDMTSVIGETDTGVSDLNSSALALGGMNYGVTVRELTSAYQIFANKGVFNGSRTVLMILDSEGNVIVDNTGKGEAVISEGNAAIMTKMMQEVVSRGTASKLTIDSRIDVAGKTGTTSDDNDRWFMGYTPYYLGGVWFGYAMPKSLAGFSETSSPALLVWDDVMTLIHQQLFDSVSAGNESMREFEVPSTVFTRRICTKSGLLPSEGCSTTEIGYFTADNVPTTYCSYTEDSKDDKDESNDSSSAVTTASPDTTSSHETTTIPVETDNNIVDTTTETTKAPVVE